MVNEETFFVLDEIECSGDENSLFSCHLGPYAPNNDCGDGDIVTLACADQLDKLEFRHVVMEGKSVFIKLIGIDFLNIYLGCYFYKLHSNFCAQNFQF